MKRLISVSLALFFAVTLAQTIPAAATDAQPRKIVSGWIPYYSVKTVMPFIKKIPTAVVTAPDAPVTCADNEYLPEDIAALNASYLFTNKDLMQEVMPFWFTLKTPTVIRDDYSTANPSWPIKNTLCLMRKSGLKLIPTITDGTDKLVLAGYLANSQTRTTIVKSIVDLVNKYSFDGIDLDFEGFAFVDGNTTWAKTAPNWIAFIKELSIALHTQQKLLSVSAPYSFDPAEKSKGYTVYAWAGIASSIDRLRIMTYDYSVAKPGPIGPISWTEKTVKYAISIMSPSKVFLGLPGYGRDWITSVRGTCPVSAPPGLTAGAKAATFKMNYANAKALIDQATPIFDAASSEATYSYTQSFNGLTAKGAATACTVARTVWYQNDRSYTERMNLVAQYKLGGSALWTLGMEDPAATTAMRNVAMSIAPDTVTSVLTIDNGVNLNVMYGGIFTLRGALTLSDKSPAIGIPVAIQMKRSGQSEWLPISTITSGIDGTISAPIKIGASATFRLITEGTWERSDSVSNEEKVVILSRIIVDRPTSVMRNHELVVKGFLLPASPSQSVIVQKYAGGKWQIVGNPSTTGANGEFSTSIIESKKGVVTLRIQITSTSGVVTSSQFSVVIR